MLRIVRYLELSEPNFPPSFVLKNYELQSSSLTALIKLKFGISGVKKSTVAMLQTEVGVWVMSYAYKEPPEFLIPLRHLASSTERFQRFKGKVSGFPGRICQHG